MYTCSEFWPTLWYRLILEFAERLQPRRTGRACLHVVVVWRVKLEMWKGGRQEDEHQPENMMSCDIMVRDCQLLHPCEKKTQSTPLQWDSNQGREASASWTAFTTRQDHSFVQHSLQATGFPRLWLAPVQFPDWLRTLYKLFQVRPTSVPLIIQQARTVSQTFSIAASPTTAPIFFSLLKSTLAFAHPAEETWLALNKHGMNPTDPIQLPAIARPRTFEK